MTVIDSILGGLDQLFRSLPGIIGGLILLIALWVIAGFVGKLIQRAADGAGADRLTQRAGINSFLEHVGWKVTAGRLLGLIATWWIRILAIEAAVNAFGIPQLSQAVQSIFAYIPTVFAAALILLVGAFLARVVGDLVGRFAEGSNLPWSKTLGPAAQVVMLIVVVVAVLQQLHIAATVVQDLLVASLALIVGAGILGLGLAFGLGGRERAQQVIADLERRMQAQHAPETPPAPDSPPEGSPRA